MKMDSDPGFEPDSVTITDTIMANLPEQYSDLTPDQLTGVARRLARAAEGTAKEPWQLLSQCHLPEEWEEHVEELLVDENVEACSGCGWWYDCGDLIDHNNEVVGCDDCRHEREE